MIDTSAEWDIVSQLSGESWFAARLYYGDQTSYLSIGSKDFELDDEKFLGIISNKPAIKGGFDIQTREFKIAGGMLEIINHIDQITTFGLLASTLGSGDDVGFENRRVDLRLMKDGISKFDNGYPLLQNGRMYRPGYGRTLVTIRIEDNTKNIFGTMGHLVTQHDATVGYQLPPASAGRIRPIIYGDHRYLTDAGNEGNTLTKEEWFPNEQPRFVPMVDLGGGRWLVEDHEIAGTPSRVDGACIWAFNQASSKWVQTVRYDVIQNSGSGVILEFLIEDYFGFVGYQWFDFKTPVNQGNVGTFEWADPPASADQDVTTGSTVTLNGVNNAATMRYGFDLIKGFDEILWGELMLTGIGDWASNNNLLYVDGIIGKFYSPGDLTITFVEAGGNIADPEGDEVDVTFKCGPSPPASGEILDVYRVITFQTLALIGPLYWGGLGHALEAWVDDANRSSHIDFGNSGEPATNPATCVESVSRGDMGLTDDVINMPSFDQASNDLSGALANFDFREEADYKLFLSQMAKQFRSIIGLDTNSKVGMKVISNRYTSADVIINYNDMSGLKFGRTDDDLLVNKLVVEYGYDGDIFLKNTDEIENTTTRTRYNLGVEATSRTLKANKINDSADADAYAGSELAFWQQHHNTIDEMSLDMAFMKYSPGDVIRIADLPEALFPNGEDVTNIFTRAGQDILPYFLITDFDKSDRVIFKGIQMHDTTP